MEKIVKEFLKEHGFDNNVDENQESRVYDWLEIYKGTTKKYKIKIYNGKCYVPYTIKSLNLPNQMCGDLADFFFNEKLDITISDKNVQEQINACLEQNGFILNGNNLMQLVRALGTGAFVPYLDNGVLRINYLNATNIVILKANANTISDVLFWNKIKIQGGYKYILNLHVLEDEGYVIYNAQKIEKGKAVENIDLGEENSEIHTYSFLPKFGIVKTPDVNYIDVNSPYGVSSYADAMDAIFQTDKAYDSLGNEIDLGKKRIYVKTGALKYNTNENGEIVPIFDVNDVAYYAMPGDDDDGKELLKESSFDLRIEEISSAIQYNLNIVSSKVGLGHNYYKFKDGEVYVNTDNVISSNSDVYRKMKKQQNIISKAINDLIYAIAELIGIKEQFSISIDFDDSIIEDTEKTRQQAQSEYNLKLISKAQYYRDVYKLKDKEALQFAKQMNKEIVEETITDGIEPAEANNE